MADEEKRREYRRKYYLANREKLLTKSREYRAANLQTIREKERKKSRELRRTQPEKTRAAQRKYKAAHREEIRMRSREYNRLRWKTQRAKLKEQYRNWRKKHPEYDALVWKRRSADPDWRKKRRERRAASPYDRMYREAHRETLRKQGREYMRQRWKTDPTLREYARKYAQDWRKRHPGSDAEAYKRLVAKPGWAAHHAKLVRELVKRKYHSDPEFRARLNLSIERRRALKLGNGPADLIKAKQVWDRDKGICGICGKPVPFEKFELDHIRPLSKGGTHTFSNVQVAHRSCNSRKGARWPYPHAMPPPSLC
jgi:hypothetical protein